MVGAGYQHRSATASRPSAPEKATVLENGVSDGCRIGGNPVFLTLSLLVLRTYKGGGESERIAVRN